MYLKTRACLASPPDASLPVAHLDSICGAGRPFSAELWWRSCALRVWSVPRHFLGSIDAGEQDGIERLCLFPYCVCHYGPMALHTAR